MKNKIDKKVVALIILVIVFIIIAMLVCLDTTNVFDTTITNFIHRNISGEIHKILEVITFVGGVKFLPLFVLFICLVLVLKRKRNCAELLLFNSLLSTIAYIVLKNIIQRPRPSIFLFITETGYSFPSGHATNNMAFYGMLIYLSSKTIKDKKVKIFTITLLSLWIVIMGITRIYFNVHYPSDVIAGYVLGSICILISLIIETKRQKKILEKIQK